VQYTYGERRKVPSSWSSEFLDSTQGLEVPLFYVQNTTMHHWQRIWHMYWDSSSSPTSSIGRPSRFLEIVCWPNCWTYSNAFCCVLRYLLDSYRSFFLVYIVMATCRYLTRITLRCVFIKTQYDNRWVAISLLPNELLLGNPGTVALALMKRTRHWETKQVACRKAMRASAGWRLLRFWISNEVKWGRSMTISWTRRLKWGNESVLIKLDWLLQRTKPPMRRNRSCRRVQPQSVVYD